MDALKNEINELQAAFDLQEVVKRAVKYLIEGDAVYFKKSTLRKEMNVEEIVMIKNNFAGTFALLICMLLK